MQISKSNLTGLEQRKLKCLTKDPDFAEVLRSVMRLPEDRWPMVREVCRPIGRRL